MERRWERWNFFEPFSSWFKQKRNAGLLLQNGWEGYPFVYNVDVIRLGRGGRVALPLYVWMGCKSIEDGRGKIDRRTYLNTLLSVWTMDWNSYGNRSKTRNNCVTVTSRDPSSITPNVTKCRLAPSRPNHSVFYQRIKYSERASRRFHKHVRGRARNSTLSERGAVSASALLLSFGR